MALAEYIPDTDIADTAAELLPVVRDAARTLSRSAKIPADIDAVIEKLYQQLPTVEQWSGVDGYLAASLNQGLVRCFRALEHDDDTTRAELRIGLEQIAQSLAYLLDEAPVADRQEPHELLSWLTDVTEAPRTDLAELLGVSTSTVARWLAKGSVPGSRDEARLRVVARIVANLRHSMTAEGLIEWFVSAHPDLGGRAPAAFLGESDMYPQLLRLSSRTRSTVVV